MRTYYKTFHCSDTFPVEKHEEWNVKENGRVVERWTCVGKTTRTFTVRITEFVPPSN